MYSVLSAFSGSYVVELCGSAVTLTDYIMAYGVEISVGS